MLSIEMLPAQHGDCLWIEYGPKQNPNRVLIDAGTQPTWKKLAARIGKSKPHFELFIVSHVDADHIEGAIMLLGDQKLGVSFGDIWFNGWGQLKDLQKDQLGALQGEFLTAVIDERGLPLNGAQRGKPVMLPAKGKLPSVPLPGGARVTLLSPGKPQLLKLRTEWDNVVRDEGFAPGNAKAALAKLAASKFKDALGAGVDVSALASTSFTSDSAVANGSSIAVLIEAEGKAVLLGADAYSTVLADSVDRLLAERKKPLLELDAFKLPHHGSRNNVHLPLLDKLKCRTFLFSSNGAHFQHPDLESVARVISRHTPSALWFNYRTRFNEVWDDPKLKKKHGYQAFYPGAAAEGIRVDL